MFFRGRSVHADGGVPVQLYSYRNLVCGLRSRALGTSTDKKASIEYNTWCELVGTYSKLQLSDSADKLLAMSAIAEAVEAALLDCNSATENYKAGLWQQHMPINLLWYNARQDPCFRPPYRAPSWSWASIDRGVTTFDYNQINSHHPNCYTAAVLSVDVSLASRIAPYGQVMGGKLQIDGLVKHIPNLSMVKDIITLQDPEYEFEEHIMLDAIESSTTSCNRGGISYLISVLCVIRLPRSQEELDFPLQRLNVYRERCYSKSYEMCGLVLRRKADEMYHSRIIMFHLIRDDPRSEASLQRWQDSFIRKTITIV
jgi:hypothetical protein